MRIKGKGKEKGYKVGGIRIQRHALSSKTLKNAMCRRCIMECMEYRRNLIHVFCMEHGWNMGYVWME